MYNVCAAKTVNQAETEQLTLISSSSSSSSKPLLSKSWHPQPCTCDRK